MRNAAIYLSLSLCSSCGDPVETPIQQSTLLKVELANENGANVYVGGVDGKQKSASLGYGKFNIINHGEVTLNLYLPSWPHDNTEKLEVYAFRNCYYRTIGRKKTTGTTVVRAWKKAVNEPQWFNDLKELSSWSDLLLECRDLSDPPPIEDDAF